jgi:hypothetical protein
MIASLGSESWRKPSIMKAQKSRFSRCFDALLEGNGLHCVIKKETEGG